MQIFTGESIAEQFGEWGVSAEFVGKHIAPQLVHYNFNLTNILHIQKIKKLLPVLSALCGVSVTLSDDKSTHFAIDIEREERGICYLNEFCDKLSKSAPYSVALGKDTNGDYIIETMDNLCHVLVGGVTGCGKSKMIESMLMSLLCYNSPQNLKVVLIDPKRTAFSQFGRVSHLLYPVATETSQAKTILDNLVVEMEQRYKTMEQLQIDKITTQYPRIVVFIDELTDLVMCNEDIKTPLIRLLQKARQCNINIVVGTQSPRASVLTGLLLANLPTRICMTCATNRESVLISGKGGCENLMGKGDYYLVSPSTTIPKRLQAPFISREEIQGCMQ